MPPCCPNRPVNTTTTPRHIHVWTSPNACRIWEVTKLRVPPQMVDLTPRFCNMRQTARGQLLFWHTGIHTHIDMLHVWHARIRMHVKPTNKERSFLMSRALFWVYRPYTWTPPRVCKTMEGRLREPAPQKASRSVPANFSRGYS